MNVTVSVGSASVAIGDALTTVSVYTTPGVMELLVIVGGVFPMDTVADRTGAPESFPSVGVTSHDTVSALANAVLFNVAVVGETYAVDEPSVRECDRIEIIVHSGAGCTRKGGCCCGCARRERDTGQNGCCVVDDNASDNRCPAVCSVVGGDGTGHCFPADKAT